MQFAADYTRAATAIYLPDQPGGSGLAPDPVPSNAAITVRVTYLFQCAIPLVRNLLCDSAESLLTPAEDDSEEVSLLALSEMPGALLASAPPGTRFRAVTREVTLPNQRAGYY